MNIVKDRTVVLLVAMLLVVAALSVWRASRNQQRLVRVNAKEAARRYTDVVREFRSLYTSEVVARVGGHGVAVTHAYRDSSGAIPLPATLSMMLGNRIAKNGAGGRMRLYSPYPFPWRRDGGLTDDFKKEAWRYLNDHPGESFFRVETRGGHARLRYATADLMRPGCVGCHNSHPDTPKTGWKVGDVRGVLEVAFPLDGVVARASAVFRESLMFGAGLFALALFCLIIVIRRLRSESKHLERKVEERTAQLLEEIREREEMATQLQQSRKLESVGRLAAGIAHEVNTPMQYIGDNTRFLQDGFQHVWTLLELYRARLDQAKSGKITPEVADELGKAAQDSDLDYLSEETSKAFEQTLDGVERVSKIVRAMKEFSHPGQEEKTPVDLNHAIETTVTVARNEWKYVAEMRLDLDASLPAVPCIPGEINQVMLNVIVNAAHAIEDAAGNDNAGKGTITVSTRQDGEWVEVRISDTGRGVPEEIRDKLFDPFFTTRKVGAGTGQGLAIAHSIVVDKHGGTIDFESTAGMGTTFVIRLPLKASGQRTAVPTARVTA